MIERKQDGVSNATVNKEVCCLKGTLSRAAEWGYIQVNQLLGIKMLKEAPIRNRYLTREEACKLLNVSSPYLQDIILFALATGFRQDEIFSVKWSDVTIHERFQSGEITVVGKGEKRRTIKMNKTIFEMMVRLKKTRKGNLVFPSPKTGRKIINIDRSFRTALENAGISDFRFHDLRHTAASWMVQGGVSIYAVKEILGHAQVSTTQRYAHHSPEYLGNQIGVLDEFLKPQNDTDEEPPMEVAV